MTTRNFPRRVRSFSFGSLIPALGLAFGLAATPSAFSALIVYEGFDYDAGSQLFGLNGGAGWATPWSATAAALATNVSVGLSYGALATTGGGVVMGNPSESTTTTASSQRLLPDTMGNLAAADAGTLWLSFLSQNWRTETGGLPGFREAKLSLFSGATTNASGNANVNGSEKMNIGTPNTYAAGASDALSLYGGGAYVASSLATPRGADPDNTVFVVVRLDVDNTTATDTAYAWFNPSLASEPMVGTAISFASADLSAVNALRLQAGNLNSSGTNAVFEADEIRLGYTFADVSVVPEPSVLWLFGFGLLALAPRIRKG
ncbi:MAG TPA: PEP-CTERM sorting domain-containing protein [Candidatus Paceibacterota bacterium]|nr:PEP-CTERM sorting domain-containing protein [Verrucomicrobiota bacterium]HRZ45782.1 PEP-CTERM sorting domain-containing protein [Candidatus Paceibacterota bacterium]